MKEKEELQEEIEEYDEYDEDDEDEEYEVDDSYEAAIREAREERKKIKEEAMKQAFKRDESTGIRKVYNFFVGYATFMKVLTVVCAVFVVIVYLILAISAEEPTIIIPAFVTALVLIIFGIFEEAVMKWFAYVLKTLHEINQKLK